MTRRCMSESKSRERCKNEDVINPKSSIEILKNNLSLQVRPQKIRVTTRINEQQEIKFNYTLMNYPLDLYYIMDFSKSMDPHKSDLVNIAEDLIDALTANTKNFRIGFGSFIDKRTLPFVSSEPNQ